MLTWLRRLMQAPPSLGEVRRRLDEVEEDVAFLFKARERERGRATGGLRKQAQPEASVPRDPRIPPDLDARSAAIWQRRLNRGGNGDVQVHG
jgi:hypothetical protein